MAKNTELNDNELLFIGYYFSNGFNGTQAYKLLKPSVSEESAAVEAHKWLRKPKISAEVEKRKLAIKSKCEIKTEEIVEHLKNLIQDCLEDKDRPNLIKALDMLNKMSGNYLQKIDMTTNGQNISDIKVNIIKPKKD